MNNNCNNNLKEIYQINPYLIEHMNLRGLKSVVKTGGSVMKKTGSAIKTGAKKVGTVAKNNPGKALLAAGALGVGTYVLADSIHDTVDLNNSQFTISKITLNDSITSAYKIDFLNPDNKEISINDTITLLDTNNNIIGEDYTIIDSDISNIIVTILDPNFNLSNDNKYFTVHTTILRQGVDSTADLVRMGGKTAGSIAGAAAGGLGSGISGQLDLNTLMNIKTIGIALLVFFLIVIILWGVYYVLTKKSS